MGRLHKDYDRKGAVAKFCGRESRGAWRQDELIGGKPPVVKQLLLWLRLALNSETGGLQAVFSEH
jgi:hypothetical protein